MENQSFPVQIMIYIHGGFSTSFGFFLYVYKRVTPEETYDLTLRYSNVAGRSQRSPDLPIFDRSTTPDLRVLVSMEKRRWKMLEDVNP